MEELTLFEMQQVVGGISQKQYCDTLVMIMAGDLERGEFAEYRKVDVYYQKHCA